MSLTVEIRRFKTIKLKFPKYVRIEFRKTPNITAPTTQTGDYIELNQRFSWDLGNKPLGPGETLTVFLMECSRWNNEKVLGVYRLGMQVLVNDRYLEVIDALVNDTTNLSISVFIEMRVFYDPAGELPGTAERMAGFIVNTPVEDPPVHTTCPSKKTPSDKKTLSLTTAAVHQISRAMARRKAYTSQRACTMPQYGPRPGITLPVSQPVIATQSFQRNITPHLPVTEKSPMPRQGSTSLTFEKRSTPVLPLTNTSPKSRQRLASPTTAKDSTSSSRLTHSSAYSQEGSTSKMALNTLLPSTHTSFKSQQGMISPTSAKGLTSPIPLKKTSPTSRPGLTPQLRLTQTPTKSRQALASSTSKNGSKAPLSLVHTSQYSQQELTSPSSRQAITSPTSRQTISAPQVREERASSLLPSAFHQALKAKYAKNAQHPDEDDSSSSQSSLQGSRQSSPRDSAPSSMAQSDNEESDPLMHVAQNIATLERSLKNQDVCINIDSEDDNTTSRGSKLKLAGKRILSRHWSFGEASAERASKNALELAPKHKGMKNSAFRSVRNFIRLGRSKTRDSSCDEEMGLLDMAAGGSVPDVTSQTSMSSEEAVLVDLRSLPDTPKMTRKMRNMIESRGPSAALKAADFQVCITIIEARQLAGLNMDPIVTVQVGDIKKFTSVKESTNCPYYNEYFVFDFHMPPVMLLDKIITLSVRQSRHVFRPNKLLGSFKLDVATVWKQPDRQFYHKWALLTDPDDISSGPKGFLKCDICVIGKGDQIKVPPKSEKDEDDIEANMLLPDGVSLERQRARFIVRIHKADGLPKMTYSLMANVKKALTGESQDLVDPYVEVSFAGMTGQTTVCKNTNCPDWNEQIIFTEMFPPLCQRIKIQLKDHDAINHQKSNVIGTHFMDLGKISNDGDRGFPPNFGPAYVYLYGSTRDYSLIDQHSSLNDGVGEGVSYRGRILISIRTEIMEILEYPQSTEVEVESLPAITESTLGKNVDFFLFCSIFEANMIDKRLSDKNLAFELSIGNSGNSLDGCTEPISKPKAYSIDEMDALKVDTGFWHSLTMSSKPSTHDKQYYYLPIQDDKPCMQIRTIWPDHRRRMYNSNLIANIIEKFEEGLADTEITLNNDNLEAGVLNLKSTLEAASNACTSYVLHMTGAPPFGNTRLDREKQRLCLHELEKLSVSTKNLKVLITKSSMKERLRTAYTYLNKLRHLCEDAQHSMPDVFIWLIGNGKRLAYHRVPAREIIYSEVPDEAGKYCAKVQTLFLKWPGKKATSPSGWAIPAKVNLYFWLGAVQDKAHYIDGLPPGFQETSELKNASLQTANAPTSIFYTEIHKFQMRAYVYQGRSLIGSDASGLSDPFARIIIGNVSQTTQVKDQTLSPTWDETLVFEDIKIHSTIENIKADPPTVVIEIFDQDSVGKSEFIGRALVKPFIKSLEDRQCLPALEWHDIRRGDDMAGELLATFELIELLDGDESIELPSLPSPRPLTGIPPTDLLNKGPIMPVPQGIRPTLSKYRIEVLFWGLRDLKRVHFLTVNKPRVDIECSGHTLTSTVIQNANRNPNFNNPTKFIELELPDQDVYQPPLTIRVVDCRSFGRNVLVGTHTINSIQKYIFTPMSKRERDIEERKKSTIQLHNVDLRAKCIIQEDVFTIGHERENMPLLPRSAPISYAPERDTSPRYNRSRDRGTRGSRRRKISADSSLNEDDAGSKDWWTKYFASYDAMIDDMKEKNKKGQSNLLQPAQASTSSGVSQRSARDDSRSPARCDRACGGARRKIPQLSKVAAKSQHSSTSSSPIVPAKKNQIPKSALSKVYPHELEAVPEYEEFKESLRTFDLYRGKKTGDDCDDESRVVGSFKGAIRVYKWPFPKDIDDSTIMGHDFNFGVFQGVPKNEPRHVLVRIYIVKATDLHPMDMNGKADPYIVLNLGNKTINDSENYVSKQLNPVFGKCYEIEATFPQDSNLTIAVYDWDLVTSDEMIGETKIDLENRFYSRHRATCGLPQKYEETGYNRWRDSLKPTQILSKLCKDGKIEPPVYEHTRVKVGRTVFNMPLDEELFSNPDVQQEQMALVVLRRWEEIPRVGCHLVTEHVETRSLYHPSKPGIEQGRLEMWVDMFPMDMPAPGPPLEISPRTPKSYELRVVIWNTDDVVLEDDAFFTGEKMSDIYVKGWLKDPDDCQSTDVHYRSLTGEGNFNWRFVFPFKYLEAEERIVTTRKKSVFSWDETECKIPARLELQVWDADHFTSDDFLGALTLDLNRFPRGAKSAKLCTLDMMSSDGAVPTINIFKQKRVRGWWPFYIKQDTEEMELTGKLEAEIHLLTCEEAEKQPAGLGHSEPDAMDKPNRPDASFMWLLNPLKSIRYIMWNNQKWAIIRYGGITFFCVGVLIGFYAFPGYMVKKLLGA